MPRLEHNPIPQFSEKDLQRFWAKVDRRGADECWPWTAGRFVHGYGRFKVRLRWRNLYANRVAFFLQNGIDPLEKCVCHSCDNPPCCNPAHLFLGTQGQNVRQMWDRQRSYDRLGEHNSNARLSLDQVAAIRAEYAAGISLRKLAKKYDAAQTQIGRIVHHESWTASATTEPPLRGDPSRKNPGLPGEQSPHAKLTQKEIEEIRRRYKEGGVTQKQLGREYGIVQCHVQRIVTNKSWRHIPTEIG